MGLYSHDPLPKRHNGITQSQRAIKAQGQLYIYLCLQNNKTFNLGAM
jgi:hypothetical protein